MNLPRYDKPPPELKEVFARYKLGASRVKPLLDALPETERNDPDAAKKLVAKTLGGVRLVCECWAARFGGLLNINNDRMEIIWGRLVRDSFTVEELVWAGEAYHRWTQTNDWHRKERMAGRSPFKSFENFYRDERLDQWIIKGRELIPQTQYRESKSSERRRETAESAQADSVNARLEAAFRALPSDEQQERITKAAQLIWKGRPLGAVSMNNVFVRRTVLGQLQKDLDNAKRNGVPPLSQSLAESLGG